ncbi:hypothetical protein CBL_13914 [Carabus blaptoides fortunei]
MTSIQNMNKNRKKFDRKTTNVTNVLTKLNYKHSKTNDSTCNLHCAKNSWERVPQNFHNPYPICYLHRAEKITDPLLSEILFKQEHKRKLENIKSYYKHNLKRGENNALIYCYAKLQKLLTDNGDEYLHNDCKWFYVGNTLDVQTTAPDNALVFHVVNNTQLSISDIERKDSCWSHRYTENIDDNLIPIYQIDTLRNISTTLVCTRHKYNISRYTVTENNGKICGKLVDTNRAIVPFIGLTLNKKSQSEYATVDIAQTVKIWDNRSGKEILNVSYDDWHSEENELAQVLYHNIHTLAYVNSSSIDLIDTRTGNLCCKINGSKLSQVSNKFCNVCMNLENEFFCYICTDNSVMQLDFRTKGVVNTWSHTFKKPPFLSSFSHQADCNIVCMSSYKPNEKFLLYHSADKCYIPTYLPTLTDSFESFVANSPQKDVSMHAKQRLNVSTAGIHVLKSYDNLFSIFSANSLGDVYCQDITNLEQNVTTCRNGPFKKWNKKIQKLSKTEESLNVVDKLYLRQIHLNANFRTDSTRNHGKTNYLRNCITDLKSRNKAFSAKITEVWYDKTEASILENIEELPREETVKNWLNEFSNL